LSAASDSAAYDQLVAEGYLTARRGTSVAPLPRTDPPAVTSLSGLRDHWHDPDHAARQGVVVGYATPAEHAYRAALDALARALTAPGPRPR
jgi:DNA-binding transcriptional MocR family regulator